MELFSFVKEYLAAPKAVGGFAPSSRGLAELITDAAGVAEADVVVEFGPGTGVFTEVIARKLKPDARCCAIEIREDFAKAVAKRCPGIRVFHGSATDAGMYLKEMGEDSCDCIVSGLPFALFEEPLQDALLDAAHDILRPGGVFVTFTYIMSPLLPRGKRLRDKLDARFSSIATTPVVWMNFLPAFAYRAQKK